MTDGRRHGGEDFRIAGIKTSMTSAATNSHSVPRAGDVLQQPFSREDVGPVKTSEFSNLQLVNMVRDNPVLYDEEYQASIPDAQLRIQKREAWDRIRADICWQDTSLIQDVWYDLFDQYARKQPDLTEAMMEAMRWTEPLINKKKFPTDSRPPSQLNPMSSALDKDFYNDVPLAEDVLEPEQNIVDTPQSLKYDYVVIQPSVGLVRTNSHQPVTTQTPTFPRRKSPSPRPTEAIVRSYPLSPKRINHRMPNTQEQRDPNQLNDVKKEGSSMNFSRTGVLVEVEPSSSYSSSNAKLYKLINPQRNSLTAQAPKRMLQQPPRASSLRYDNTMPDQIIEPPRSIEPPKKKTMIDSIPLHRNSGPSSSSMQKHHIDSNGKIVSDSSPMVDDEVILANDGECKIPSGMLLDSSLPSTSQSHQMSQGMDTQQADSMHQYDIEMFLEDNEVVVEEEIEQQPIVGGHDLTIQYDEDLAFQQHINGVLNRLQDDDKAMVKFHMQKIILDARFGDGTAKNVLEEGDLMLVGSGHPTHPVLPTHQPLESLPPHEDNDHGIVENSEQI